jgi:hypothetical protein
MKATQLLAIAYFNVPHSNYTASMLQSHETLLSTINSSTQYAWGLKRTATFLLHTSVRDTIELEIS